MTIARNDQERMKIRKMIRVMLESSFYLEMKLKERLQLIKVLVASHS